jgi:hypothetical protein
MQDQIQVSGKLLKSQIKKEIERTVDEIVAS